MVGSRRVYRRTGFTLIELLVVISIIAVLAAIVLPVYNGVQERARQNQCISNLHGIALALKLYKNDYRAYPLGALGTLDGLQDDNGNAAYTANAYDTADPATGRKTRIDALFPSYIREQKALICPDENGDTLLIDGFNADPANSFNGQNSADVLAVGADGTASTYDDLYNVFGYQDDDTGFPGGDLHGAPITAAANMLGGGRNAMRLTNRYAPDTTIVTGCREHEEDVNPATAIRLVIRLGATFDRVTASQYSWSTQPETPHE